MSLLCYLDLIFGIYDPKNPMLDTQLGTRLHLLWFRPYRKKFGDHLEFGASLWTGKDFKPQIRILRQKLHRHRPQTRHQRQIPKFSTPEPLFWLPSWIGGVTRKIELDNIEILLLNIKTKRLRQFSHLFHLPFHGKVFLNICPQTQFFWAFFAKKCD